MKLKETHLQRAAPENVRRLAKWLGINIDQDINLIIEELRAQLPPSYSVPWMPKGFRGKVT